MNNPESRDGPDAEARGEDVDVGFGQQSAVVPVLRFNPFSSPSTDDEDYQLEEPEKEYSTVPPPVEETGGLRIPFSVRPPEGSSSPKIQLVLFPPPIPHPSPVPGGLPPSPSSPELSLPSVQITDVQGTTVITEHEDNVGAPCSLSAGDGGNEPGAKLPCDVRPEAAPEVECELGDVSEAPEMEDSTDSSTSLVSGVFKEVYLQALRNALLRRVSGG